MTKRPYQSEVTAELRERNARELARLMEQEAAAAGVLTEAQLAQFERQLTDKPAKDDPYFPVAVLLMRHIRAMEGK